MKQPNSVREALLAEALGEFAQLLDRLEKLRPLMDETREDLAHANENLSQRMIAFEARYEATLERGKENLLQFVVQRANQHSRQLVAMHTEALKEAARTHFQTEIRASTQQLAASLNALAARIERTESPWLPGLTHTAVAFASTIITYMLVFLFAAK